MDALAVSIAAGITLGRPRPAQLARMPLTFGLFQAAMPIAGWLLGLSVRHLIESWDHWIAFALLAFVGINMLREAFSSCEEEVENRDPTSGVTLLLLGRCDQHRRAGRGPFSRAAASAHCLSCSGHRRGLRSSQPGRHAPRRAPRRLDCVRRWASAAEVLFFWGSASRSSTNTAYSRYRRIIGTSALRHQKGRRGGVPPDASSPRTARRYSEFRSRSMWNAWRAGTCPHVPA